MYRSKHQHLWLALLTALLLFMQSFAIWHDAEHAFHHEDSQCERFEAFAHNPTLDIVNSTPLINISQYSIEIITTNHVEVVTRQRDAYAIRAPPSLFS